MQIAVLSDTHDHVWRLDQAIPYLKSADVILHCGDLCSPFVLVRMGSALSDKPIHVVLGNNDGDPRLLTLKALEAGNIHLHGQFASIELDGLRVALNHYPEIARPIAASNEFDLVCYGHDHIAFTTQINRTVLLNPGEMLGMNGRSTFALFDTQTLGVTWIELSLL